MGVGRGSHSFVSESIDLPMLRGNLIDGRSKAITLLLCFDYFAFVHYYQATLFALMFAQCIFFV